MRILFVNSLRGYYGGVEQVVEDYARELARRGHNCFLAYQEDGRDPEQYSQSFTDTFVCTQLGSQEADVPFSQITENVSPDVIFVHKVGRLPPDFENDTQYRKVLMVHDHDLWCPKGTGYYTFNRQTCKVAAGLPCYLDGAFLERSKGGLFPVKFQSIWSKTREMRRNHHFDTILVLSNFLKQKLILNGFPSERIRISHPVVKQLETKLSPLPEAPKILFVGSLIRGKGVDLLIRAVAQLNCPFQLDIVGEGKEESNLRALAAELGVTDKVNFAGWVPHDGLSRHYHAARVVAVPSCWPEPFGLIGQEAMGFARPVVAFDVGGIPDWCSDGKTGFTVPEQDVVAFAKALEKLLTDYDLAQKFGIQGKHQADTSFSFDANMDNVESLLLNG